MSSTEPQARATVRRGDPSDAPTVAALHAEQIHEGFLAFLGPQFLVRLYRRICRTPTSFLLVAEHGGERIGFIAGSADVPALDRQFIVRDGPAAALGSLTRLVPRWRQVLETLRHGSSGVGTGRGVELLAVAVSGRSQGGGVGRLLVRSFLDEVARRDQHSAYVVVGAENAAAVALYRAAGFSTDDEVELHTGTVSLVMQWDEGDAPVRGPGQPPP